MSDDSKIEWTDATWNPVTGCVEVSPGCDHCYAKTFAERFRGTAGHPYENGFDLQLRPERLDQPLRWTRPRRVFVNSMSDLFQDGVSDEFIADVFAVMALAQRHTFQVLTKRHGRMRALLSSKDFRALVQRIVLARRGGAAPWLVEPWWPLANVWLGVSVEDQKWAGVRIPALLDTPAAVRWISAEPLLGPINLTYVGQGLDALYNDADMLHPALDWVVVGGESGPGARPMDPHWARQLRDDCAASSVPFLFKQWGAWAPSPTANFVSIMDSGGHEWKARMYRAPKSATGRELDGRTWDEYPS